ncbi:hypothetical protein Q8W71_20940 [Methylobacterium sp. NEAU 140]|uniref:hypothetical protein n=1 Tax=Methylobacterium sp. NEAU 140 TaxID=3064945 RepID=UPI0027369AD3|nr:hypothetical protein [Methylobacterium sp. NEAU 140]MDP4025100.1 hypothetical protein [Methylobacterium sp. NEAU 140]
MVQRFTVIQGGLSGAPAAIPATIPGPAADAAWRVDLQGPGGVDDGAVLAWRALMTREGVSDPLRDPDYLLPLARHRAGGRRVALALAWSRDADGPETLRGVVPLALPHPVLGRSARTWRPAEAGATALVDGAAPASVEGALRGRLRGMRRPLRLVGGLDGVPARGPRGPVPAAAFVGVRPEGWTPPAQAEVAVAAEPAAVRDAVETLLALDARTAKAPIVADPSEASLVRVVSRLFARRRACRVEIFRRAGEVVAGALHLGSGPAAVLWRRAGA